MKGNFTNTIHNNKTKSLLSSQTLNKASNPERAQKSELKQNIDIKKKNSDDIKDKEQKISTNTSETNTNEINKVLISVFFVKKFLYIFLTKSRRTKSFQELMTI